MTITLRVYLLAMTAPAALMMAAVLRTPSTPGDPVLMFVLVVLGAVATNFPVRVSRHYKAHAAPAIHLAAVLLFSPAIAVAVIGLSSLIGESVLCLRRNPATGNRRRAPADVVFNTSQLILAGGLSAVAYAVAGAPLAGAFLAAVVMYTVSTGLVVIAAGIHEKRSPLELWTEIAASDLKQTTALYVAGYLLAVISVGRPWLALVMMIPIAAIQVALTRSVQLMEQTIDAVEAMADVVDRRDPYTFQHSQSVAEHAVRTARRLGLPDREVEVIRLAARVHDLGKIEIPDEILHKHGRLSPAEFALMKKHPQTGADILSKFPAYRHGRELVLAHHERIDGLGYPRGLAGAAIALGARIIAVADSWDAMTSDRPYRKALDSEVALAELRRGRGTQWDPSVVDAFAESLPGAIPAAERPRWIEVRPFLRSLGAAVGVIG